MAFDVDRVATVLFDGTAALIAKELRPLRDEIAALRAELAKEKAAPRLRFKGTWQASAEPEQGDAMTHGGSLWVCCESGTRQRPGTGTGWQLALKRGDAE